MSLCGTHWFAGCGMLVAGGFCYGRLLDESCIARESQNSPAPARASDRLLSIRDFNPRSIRPGGPGKNQPTDVGQETG